MFSLPQPYLSLLVVCVVKLVTRYFPEPCLLVPIDHHPRYHIFVVLSATDKAVLNRHELSLL